VIVEGMTLWDYVAVLSLLFLGIPLALVIGVSGCVWLVQRSQQSLKVFAGGLGSGAVLVAILGMGMAVSHHAFEWYTPPIVAHDPDGRILWEMPGELQPAAFVPLVLFLGGVGQFLAAWRGPRPYGIALGCAAAAVAIVALVPSVYHSAWNVVAIGFSLVLAVTSLIIVFLPRPSP
jgi:hypothetical protein